MVAVVMARTCDSLARVDLCTRACFGSQTPGRLRPSPDPALMAGVPQHCTCVQGSKKQQPAWALSSCIFKLPVVEKVLRAPAFEAARELPSLQLNHTWPKSLQRTRASSSEQESHCPGYSSGVTPDDVQKTDAAVEYPLYARSRRPRHCGVADKELLPLRDTRASQPARAALVWSCAGLTTPVVVQTRCGHRNSQCTRATAKRRNSLYKFVSSDL